MFKAVKTLLLAALLIFDMWFIASYIDIVRHNMDSEPIYQSWNAFVVWSAEK